MSGSAAVLPVQTDCFMPEARDIHLMQSDTAHVADSVKWIFYMCSDWSTCFKAATHPSAAAVLAFTISIYSQ